GPVVVRAHEHRALGPDLQSVAVDRRDARAAGEHGPGHAGLPARSPHGRGHLRRVPAAARGPHLPDTDGALAGDRGGVDVRRRLVEHWLQQALDHGGGYRVGVDGELARQLDLELAHAPAAELADDPTQHLAELEVVAESRDDLGRQRRRVDDPARVVALERHHGALEDLGADAALRLDGVRAQVRGEHDVVAADQGVVRGRRLEHEHVEPRCEDLAALEGPEQGRLVDDPPASGVHDDGAVGQGRQPRAVEQALGLLGQGRVHGEEVGAGEERPEVVEQLDLELLGAVGREVGVVRPDEHAQALRPPGDERADAAQPHDAEARVLQLAAQEGAVPASGADQAVGPGHAARRGQHQRDGELGGRHVVRLGGVDDEDAAAAGGLQVDVVDADAAPAHDLEAFGALQELGVDAGPAAGDDRVVGADEREQVGALDAGPVVDLDVGVFHLPQPYGVGDEYPRHGARGYHRQLRSGLSRSGTPP